MRTLTIEEMDCVSGGGVSVGDVVVGSGNGVLSDNCVDVKHVLDCNSILNGSLNGSGNGTGIGNFSFND